MTTSILFVDDIPGRFRNLLRKIELNDFDLTVCTSPVEAAELLQMKKFDIVVSDIVFEGDSKDDVEKFLQDVSKMGLPLIIASGAVYLKIGVKIPRAVRLFDVPFDYTEFISTLKKEASKKKDPLPDEVIHRLANPDWHIETPIKKGGLDKRYSIHLEFQATRKMLDEARMHGDWPRRDLDELMHKSLVLKGKVCRQLKAKEDPIRPKRLIAISK